MIEKLIIIYLIIFKKESAISSKNTGTVAAACLNFSFSHMNHLVGRFGVFFAFWTAATVAYELKWEQEKAGTFSGFAIVKRCNIWHVSLSHLLAMTRKASLYASIRRVMNRRASTVSFLFGE